MYTGLTPLEAIAKLNAAGVKNHKITRLVNDKQQDCDTEIVLSVRIVNDLAEIITTLFRGKEADNG